MELKHTSGPWEIDRSFVKSKTMENVICQVESDLHHKGEQEANARLIAESPVMIDELISLVEGIKRYAKDPYQEELPETHNAEKIIKHLTID